MHKHTHTHAPTHTHSHMHQHTNTQANTHRFNERRKQIDMIRDGDDSDAIIINTANHKNKIVILNYRLGYL